MTPGDWVLVLTMIGGAVAWVVKIHVDKRKADAEIHHIEASTDKVEIETFVQLRSTVYDLMRDVQELQDKQDEYEELLKVKEAELTKKQITIEELSARIEVLEHKYSKMKDALVGVLKWADEKGYVGYPLEDGLLDTDPRMKAVKGKK